MLQSHHFMSHGAQQRKQYCLASRKNIRKNLIITQGLPVLHRISHSLETWLSNLLARSLRVCLGVPWATFGDLVITEAEEPHFTAHKIQETSGHYLRLITHHVDHPLTNELVTRTSSSALQVLQGNTFPENLHYKWTTRLDKPPWIARIPTISSNVPGVEWKSSVYSLVAAQITMDCLDHSYRTI